MSNVDLTELTPEDQIRDDDEVETIALRKLLDEAVGYVSKFRWCPPIHSKYMGFGIGGVIGVFLIKFTDPIQNSHDTELWVITGDLPSAYLVTEKAPDTDTALRIYCALMRDWIKAVESASSLDKVYPVLAAPTQENATLLRKRIDFIETEFILS